MGIVSSSIFTSTQRVQNEFLASSNQQCISQATGQVTNTTIILNNSEVGDITVESVGNADLNCILNQQMEQVITNQLASQSQQSTENSTDAFNDFILLNASINAAAFSQQIYNNITAINNSACVATSEQLVSNTLIQANYTITGDVGISANTSSAGTCTLSNIISMESFNQAAADNNQDIDNEGMLVAIMSSIAAIILLIVIVIIIIVVLTIVIKSKKKAPAQPAPTDPVDVELAALEAQLNKA